ncbi:dolichyl-diphosphooligosaccharide--protein glycotransferase KNAG_0B03550 [Huiozyma naganishii CBS 8797]|uniref:Thioredoxin domain-containing protein n=1 Tax=Huiozyma naganishii (strain ATCC MYA-139 / BCRC 22969 / CBS 8797 / KCTC 17520 / NBRC 10181 / NCYC 3082 / Yp74L-3) TaxID=1071383 RepID=J7RV66_HUIN7|nr:hypothetical protein KNAG_0B03550 [Kazachstania naganishii CBS 8797]CCK68797.1 hypothetical protein KNAG_0B03550 [Kazachstania naganishii CBS 8797]
MLRLRVKSARLLLLLGFVLARLTVGLTQGNDELLIRDDDNTIRVTQENYHALSRGTGEYYSVLFITMRSTQNDVPDCQLCHDFEEIYREVSRTIGIQSPNANVLFYIADVHEVSDLVNDLQLKNVPHVVVYNPPTTDAPFSWSEAPFYQYQFTSKSSEDHLHFASFMAETLHVYIQLEEGFDIREFFAYFCVFIVLFVGIKKGIFPKLRSKTKVGVMLMCFTVMILSICGYKFTQINNIPLLARNEEGQIMFFSGGMGWQFGIEIFTVGLMYIVMSSLVLGLIYLNNWHTMANNLGHVIAAITAVVLFYMFRYYVSCYRIKQADYPF